MRLVIVALPGLFSYLFFSTELIPLITDKSDFHLVASEKDGFG